MNDSLQPRRQGFPYATWGAGTAAVGALTALLTGVFLALPILILESPGAGEELSTGGTVAAQLATAFGFLIVPYLIAARPGGGFRAAMERLGFRSFERSAFGWIAAAGATYIAFTVVYANLITPPEQEDIASSFGALPVQFLLIVVCAAISEEVCFRGMLFGGLRRRYGRYGAALLAGMMFGLLHVTTGITAVPPLVVFGFVLALLYEKTGSLWPSILLHGLNNGLALIILHNS